MTRLLCTCGATITSSDVQVSNRCNEEGEEWHSIDATCPVCFKEYETSEWGENDSIDDAMETLSEKTDLV